MLNMQFYFKKIDVNHIATYYKLLRAKKGKMIAGAGMAKRNMSAEEGTVPDWSSHVFKLQLGTQQGLGAMTTIVARHISMHA
jgi:hypothetical protein